ncbi:MAG: (d)CMP kinase [Paludibacteraceae bacterium]|nr:(d)CMP kinase [Paludibacteraceae bacterium]
MEKKIIVAIDGFSSCGKSTIAKKLAKTVGYAFVDTGAMYRCVTLYALRNSIIAKGKIDEEKLATEMPNIHICFKNIEGENRVFLNGEDVSHEIRTMPVSSNVSAVSAIRFVRQAMVSLQQKMGEQKGIVMDGRDIGTVVFPNAELKIFVTASLEVKANRRFKELVEKGEKVTYEEVVQNVKQRDYDDQHRKESPLRKAEDAIELDNSYMTFEEQDAWVLQRFKEALNRQ